MEYPIFDVPLLGGSLLIAGIAIFHTFIAHFSVGSGLLMALAQRRAIGDNDLGMSRALHKYAFGVLLVPYVLGTVSGVGIWFSIALASPRAVSILIHQFVWFWAIEWVLFFVEGLAIHLYVFHRDRMAPRDHNRLAWIFAACSVGTLLVINAILSFMLTPGQWRPLDAGTLVYKGVLNPGYVPTSLGRILVCLALAGAGGVVLASLTRSIDEQTRRKLVRISCAMILPIILCLPLGAWTFAVLGQRSRDFITGGAPVMLIFLNFGLAGMLILFLAAAVSYFRRDFSVGSLGGITMCLLALVVFGSMEFLREGARKPFIIEGFMYSTGVTVAGAAPVDPVANLDRTRREGILAVTPWALSGETGAAGLSPALRGQAVYRAACLRCHCIDGYNAVRPLVAAWRRETIRSLLDRMDEVKPAMPPFPGNQAEKDALTEFLLGLSTRNEGTQCSLKP
jgi:mono/diheme cytochrome c family protein